MTDYFFTTPNTLPISVNDLPFDETNSLYPTESLLSKRAYNYTSENTSKDTSDAECPYYSSKKPFKILKTNLSEVLSFSDENLSDKKEKLYKPISKRGRPRKEENFKGKGKKLASEKTKEGNSKVFHKEFTRVRAFSTDISDMLSVKSLDQGEFVNFEKAESISDDTNDLWIDMLGVEDSDMSQLDSFLNDVRKEGEVKNNNNTIEGEMEQHNNINVDYKTLIATIPKFSLNNKLQRRGRKVLKPVWNPEVADKDCLNEYSNKLSKVLNQDIINEEKSLELLKKCGMDVDTALEQVNKEKVYYRSYLGANQRQLRKKI